MHINNSSKFQCKKIAAQKMQCKKTAMQKKLQKGPGPGGPVVRAFDPSPYPNLPQTIPIHILAFN